jgi:hypothetical protein
MTGTTVDGVHGGEHKCGRNATRVNSEEAYVKADKALRDTDDFEQQRLQNEQTGDDTIVVKKPLSDIYGDGYRDEVSGVRRNGSKNNPTGIPPGSQPATATDFEGGNMKGIYTRQPDGSYATHTMYPDPVE